MLRFRADKAYYLLDQIELRCFDREGQAIAKPIVFEKIESPIEIPVFMRIDLVEAQILMDALYDCGIRPSEGQGSAGQLAAVQQHLADMRQITFHKLGIQSDRR